MNRTIKIDYPLEGPNFIDELDRRIMAQNPEYSDTVELYQNGECQFILTWPDFYLRTYPIMVRQAI